MLSRLAALLVVTIWRGAPLDAQCPYGSPPPCGRPAARLAPPAANSVAVLYFQTGDTADVYLANGLTEDIATLLGDVANVQVKTPGVVRHAQRATPQDLPAIARALGVPSGVRPLSTGQLPARTPLAGIHGTGDQRVSRSRATR